MSSIFKFFAQADGRVRTRTSAPAPTDPYKGGLRTTPTGDIVYTSSAAPIASYVSGVPVTSDGRVCMSGSGGIVQGPSGGLSVGTDGRLAWVTTAPDVFHQSVGLKADGSLCVAIV